MEKYLELARDFADEISQNSYDMENACYISYTAGFIKSLELAIEEGLITREQAKALLKKQDTLI